MAATIILPTTGDRGALLPYSVGSALSQSVRDIEIFIMGDGVAESTRDVIAQMMQRDSRIRFFDHPKHARRGEPYRHAALAEARGEIVCYLTDRDLMLPNHVDVMRQLLTSADFAHTLRFDISSKGDFTFRHTLDITNRRDRKVAISKGGLLIPLSFAGHTISMYRRLPHGWRITPMSVSTDRYMWEQFLAQADCRVATSTKPTILYFKRGDHPGLPVDQRLLELTQWSEKMQSPDWISDFSETIRDGAIRDRARIARRTRDAAQRGVAQSIGRSDGKHSHAPVQRNVKLGTSKVTMPAPVLSADTSSDFLVAGRMITGTSIRVLNRGQDFRGSFTEFYSTSWSQVRPTAQWGVVASKPGVLRGMHFHRRHDEGFLLLSGYAFVGLRDVRPGSPTEGISSLFEFSGNRLALLTFPRGIVHGWLFTKESIHLQSVSETFREYGEDDNLGCHWSDPELDIPWPAKPTLLAARAQGFGSLDSLLQDTLRIDPHFCYQANRNELKPSGS